MRALRDLARFIRAKDTDEEHAEIREYVIENAGDLAEAFGVSEAAFATDIDGEPDDEKLGRRLVAEVKRARSENRAARRAQRIRAAQAAADALGALADWEDDRANVDVRALLASALTTRADVLVFEAGTFAISIPMDRLYALARLKRSDLSADIDSNGLHVRWQTGGLNFVSVKPAPKASTITVNLRARDVRAA